MTSSPIKRHSESGTVWERIDKRQVQLGDYHWCSSADPEPVLESTAPHVCMIWQVSDDQDWQPPAVPPSESQNPIDRLIDQVRLTSDQDGGNIPVLAMLYQARAVETCSGCLERLARVQESRQSVPFAALVYVLCAWLLGIITALAFHVKP